MVEKLINYSGGTSVFSENTVTSYPKILHTSLYANSADTDQTAPSGAV